MYGAEVTDEWGLSVAANLCLSGCGGVKSGMSLALLTA